MEHKKTVRLDHLIAQQYPDYTRSKIKRMITERKVTVNGACITKSGALVAHDAVIALDVDSISYVSRAGIKLAHALDRFQVDVRGLTMLDAGLSTGGFTDCLLQRGAAKVYGVDVGHDQVHPTIAADERVVVMEGVNLRNLEQLPEMVNLVTLDLSFISVTKVLDAALQFLKPGGGLIILIKPQFEAEAQHRNKKGVITDRAVHQGVLDVIAHECAQRGLASKGIIESPIVGGSGNKEFLGYWIKK